MSNREIKFRSWNPLTEVMDLHADLAYYNNQLCDANYPEDAILMQYTGQKDKNGVEIYEGDVVRRWTTSRTGTHPNNAHVWAVEYSHTDKYSGFRVAATETLEVIGNIYENPELLK